MPMLSFLCNNFEYLKTVHDVLETHRARDKRRIRACDKSHVMKRISRSVSFYYINVHETRSENVLKLAKDSLNSTSQARFIESYIKIQLM